MDITNMLESGFRPSVEKVVRHIDLSIALGMGDINCFDSLEHLYEDLKKVELLFKRYILGVVKDDKEMRIDAMKDIENLGEDMKKYFIQFRKFYDKHRNCKVDIANMIKNELI